MKKIQNKRCVRCIMDLSIPGIKFDEKGVCNYCHLQDKMEKEYPQGEEGKEITKKLVEKIKSDGEDKKYNCVIGISGGRDSTFLLYYAKKILGLRPLAVHFNDGFGNPLAGQNMVNACRSLKIDLRTITSDWRESKDLKLAFLKASALDIEEGTDLGLAAAMYGAATKENVGYILIGSSFRTEGVAPLVWNYMDGKYLKAVHKKYGTRPLRKWKPDNPGFNLDMKEIVYYTILRHIKTIPILFYYKYVRAEVDKIIGHELGWKNPGAHYYDDLYQSLITYYFRVKYNIDRRILNYSALVRSGQMKRAEALKKIKEKYVIEDQKMIDLCLKRLGLTRNEFNHFLKLPPKTFRDFPNNYNVMVRFKPIIKFMCKLNLFPALAYDKYFNCG